MRDIRFVGDLRVETVWDGTVTPRQARLAMQSTPYAGFANLLAAVEAAVLSSGDAALITSWTYASSWRRDSPEIASIGAVLGLTGDQIDALFLLARTL